MVLNAVMQLNQTILEAFNGVQIQGHVTVTPRYQWNAIPNKHRRLPAKQLRVDRPHEGVHAIETFGSGAGRQPFEIAVRTRDITVRAGSDVDDDVSPLRQQTSFGQNTETPLTDVSKLEAAPREMRRE